MSEVRSLKSTMDPLFLEWAQAADEARGIELRLLRESSEYQKALKAREEKWAQYINQNKKRGK